VAKPLKDVTKMKASFWKKLGDEVADRIQVHTKKGKDVNDANFDKYSTKYADAKRAGKFKRQSSTSTKPNLTLTGDMLRNLQTRSATNDGVIIGWSGTNAEKVEWNAKMKDRVITSDTKPVSKGIQKFIDKQINVTIDRNIKATNETKTFVIG
tara:strand:+ start:118 stop:576 length:459 start_codon:yes stop_codon:yes gene_type:complete